MIGKLSSRVEVLLKAKDEASETIASVGRKMEQSLGSVEKAGGQVERQNQRMTASSKNLVYNFSNVTTGALNLYNTYDKVEDASHRVDKANLALQRSEDRLTDLKKKHNDALAKTDRLSGDVASAERDLNRANVAVESSTVAMNSAQAAYNSAVAQFGADSPQAKTALENLEGAMTTHKDKTVAANTAQESLNTALAALDTNKETVKSALGDITTAEEGVRLKTAEVQTANENLSTAIVTAFAQSGPAVISMTTGIIKTMGDLGFDTSSASGFVDSLKTKLGNLKDVDFSGLLTKLAGLKTALLGVGAAGAAAWAAISAGMIVGVDYLIENWEKLSSIEGPISLDKSPQKLFGQDMPSLELKKKISEIFGGWKQGGGVFTSPTLIGVGEAGPEAVVPLEGGAVPVRGGGASVIVHGPLVVVEGNADRRVVEAAARLVLRQLRSVVVEPTSSFAPSTQRRIRSGSVLR